MASGQSSFDQILVEKFISNLLLSNDEVKNNLQRHPYFLFKTPLLHLYLKH